MTTARIVFVDLDAEPPVVLYRSGARRKVARSDAMTRAGQLMRQREEQR